MTDKVLATIHDNDNVYKYVICLTNDARYSVSRQVFLSDGQGMVIVKTRHYRTALNVAAELAIDRICT